MHGVQAGSSELAQVAHPVALLVGEREVGPRCAAGTVSSVMEKSRTCSS